MNKTEGYLLIDHRASPGLPADFYQKVGLDAPAVTEGKMLESATLTCVHCNAIVIMNPSFDNQFVMRLFNGEKAEVVSKIVHSLSDRCRRRLYAEFALDQAVARKRPRLETRDVAPDRDGIFVFVSGPMDDFIDHKIKGLC